VLNTEVHLLKINYVFVCMWTGSLAADLLFEDVHRRLVRFELLVLEEDLPPQLQRRRQVRVIAEVALQKEARHEAFPEHRLMNRYLKKRETDVNRWGHKTLQMNESSAVTTAGRRHGAVSTLKYFCFHRNSPSLGRKGRWEVLLDESTMIFHDVYVVQREDWPRVYNFFFK